MKFLVTGDWHIRERNSRNRSNVVDAVFHKIEWILNKAYEEDFDALLQPGDFFDTSKPSWSLFGRVVKLLDEYKVGKKFHLITVPGQHDLENHLSDVANTPIGLLERLGYVKIPTATPIKIGDVKIYGAGWGADIPKPVERAGSKPTKKIVLTHRMVIDEKLWESQSEFDRANLLLRKHKEYDLFVCGDNHKGHTAHVNDRQLLNLGCLVRTNIDQQEHVPFVYEWSDSGGTKFTEVPTLPFEQPETAKAIQKSEELDDLIKNLRSTKVNKVSFKDKFHSACNGVLSDVGNRLLREWIC